MQVGATKMVVLGTGGTMAGTAASALDNIGYTAAQLGVEALLQAVPGLFALSEQWECEQVSQIDSKDMEFAVWIALAQRCQAHLDDPKVHGVVITHGTDTLEETAWFLHSVLNARKPVVLTCAMRPATAVAPDGPQNLLDAVVVARTAGAAGVLVVCAGEIHGAQQVQKMHPYRLNAFASGDAGPWGWVEEGAVRWAQGACSPLQTKGLSPAFFAHLPWPRVEIVMNYAGGSAGVVEALVRDGIQGIVVAGTGNGTLHFALQAALERAQAAGIAVRLTTRCPLGQVLPRLVDPLPSAQGLSPVKARITLMLELMQAAATPAPLQKPDTKKPRQTGL